MANDIEFVDGLIVKPPHDKAPSYVKASISIKVEDLGKWLREKYKAGEQWVNIDVKEAKSGKWYAAVNTFKREAKEERNSAPQTRREPSKTSGGRFDDMPDEIPF